MASGDDHEFLQVISQLLGTDIEQLFVDVVG